MNYCKVEDYNRGNITGAYRDIRLYHTSNTRLYLTPEYIIDVKVFHVHLLVLDGIVTVIVD